MKLVFVIAGALLITALLFIVLRRPQSDSDKQEDYLPYRLKTNFFSQSEFIFYKALLEELDAERFGVFSKVRIADFVETTATGKDFHRAFNSIKSRHIDFVIWDNKKNKIAVGIELDGNSHNSPKMQKRDNFVNKLYKQIGFPAQRIELGQNFAEEIKNIKTQIEQI